MRNGLDIERLAIGDFGGAALAVKGSIDTRAQAPRGAIKLDLDARRLDGVATLFERFSPQAAAELRRNAARIRAGEAHVPRSTVSAGSGVGAESTGRFKIDGSAGALACQPCRATSTRTART